MTTKKHTIVYAEDDVDDLQLVTECFASYKDKIELLHAPNGQEVVDLLHQLLKNEVIPCLIILDINMPVLDGKQALVKIKSSPGLKDIPTILFTTSNSSMDVSFAKNWGADFITKPLRYEEISKLAKEFSSRCDEEIKSRD
ncbi:MAG: response regulator [Chitinophagaceae bacterium]